MLIILLIIIKILIFYYVQENFKSRHTKRGQLSMANAGPNTNGSQFFITFIPCEWLDRAHVVFGEVVEGWDVLDQLEKIGTQSGMPRKSAFIADCGEIKQETN